MFIFSSFLIVYGYKISFSPWQFVATNEQCVYNNDISGTYLKAHNQFQHRIQIEGYINTRIVETLITRMVWKYLN